MTTICHRRRVEAAFTLVELMTAIAILSVLMVFIGVLITAASKATQLSHMRMDADREARLVFDQMAEDFTRMVRRNDADFHFIKQTGNDCFFMFCDDPGYFSSNAALTSAMQSNMALVGYRVDANNTPPNDIPNTLQKLAEGLSWDYQATTTTSPMAYLTFDQANPFTPDSNSTIEGRWPGIETIPSTSPPTATLTSDSNYHIIGPSTFRLEFCFLLTDGTYSLVPARVPSGVSCNLAANADPTPSNTTPSYVVGSRWYENSNSTAANNFRGWICTAVPASGAVWQPLGMRDVQAVVVAIAILDPSSQKIISANTTALSTIAAALADPTAADLNTSGVAPKLMATTWSTSLNSSTFASTVGVPQSVAAQVRIYQRFFYLNNLSTN